jgi:hypothetical protein
VFAGRPFSLSLEPAYSGLLLSVAEGAGNFQVKQDGGMLLHSKCCKLDLPGFKNLEGLNIDMFLA